MKKFLVIFLVLYSFLSLSESTYSFPRIRRDREDKTIITVTQPQPTQTSDDKSKPSPEPTQKPTIPPPVPLNNAYITESPSADSGKVLPSSAFKKPSKEIFEDTNSTDKFIVFLTVAIIFGLLIYEYRNYINKENRAKQKKKAFKRSHRKNS